MKIKLLKYKSVKSTNNVALKLIKEKNLSPTIVSSENQTQGRGQMGKNGSPKKEIYFFQFFLK